MRKVLIAPSILSADFSDLGAGISTIEKAGADWIHLDVMDGHFVPNLTFGPPVIKSMRKRSKLPFDVHLMIEKPEFWLENYRAAGADRITFHIEACRHSPRYLQRIRELGAASGICLNPQTSLNGVEYWLPFCDQVLIMTVNPGFGGQAMIEEVITKISSLKKTIKMMGCSTLIEVDGGIDGKNARRIIEAGADILVMGSAFFGSDDPVRLVKTIKKDS